MQRPLADHDLYGLLGVHPTASPQEIRLAYRQRAMIWHPDRNQSPDAEETFKLIRSGYEVLRDPSRRADYDRHAASHSDESPARAEQPASAPQRGPHARSAPDVRRRVYITLDEQLRGGRVDLQLTRTEYCSTCGGSGSSAVPASCDYCRGSGYMRHSLGWFPFFLAAPTACTDCGGAGVTRPKCIACEGKGS